MTGWVKSIFKDTQLYIWLRGKWYAHLKEIPPKRLRKHGPAALKIVHEALKDSRALYFADYGTLLGMQRERDFILHDDDIDYSVIAGSISPAELYKLLSKRLQYSHAFEYCGLITEMTFIYKKIEIDFFFSYPQGGGLLSPFYQPGEPYRRDFGCRWNAIGVFRTMVEGVSWTKFKGADVPVPSNALELLQDTYGSWREPIEEWKEMGDYGQRPRICLKGFSTVVDADRVLELGNEPESVLKYDPE